MNKLICLTLVMLSLNAVSAPQPDEANLMSEKIENGLLIKTYISQSYSDEYQYCYQQIVVKKILKTGKIVSSDSTERCRRIR